MANEYPVLKTSASGGWSVGPAGWVGGGREDCSGSLGYNLRKTKPRGRTETFLAPEDH